MGLKVSTIARLPLDTDREYFVYFLDYGWADEFSETLYQNFDQFAEGLAGHKGLVLAGLHRQEFADEVLSWHQLNGEPAEALLPAILISGCHPEEFRGEHQDSGRWERGEGGVRKHDGALLVPLREVCETPDDVVPLITAVLKSIRDGRKIADFTIRRRMDEPRHSADMFILQPNLHGMGVDLRVVWEKCRPFFSRKRD
ncbi:MAG: hypothetical protein ACOCYW_08745, partial [Roseicyclus sp.]